MSGDLGLAGKVVIVTGAGTGLGRTYGEALLARGARLAANDLDPAALADLDDGSGRVLAHAGDVADPEAMRDLVARVVKRFGRIDGIVCNAGMLRDRTFAKMDPADFKAIMDVHLGGTVNLLHPAWPVLLEQGFGRIVVTTSTSALYGNFGQTNYDAAKLGIVGLMKALALEGRSRGVFVNAVAPLAMTRLGQGVFPDALAPLMPTAAPAAVVLALLSPHCRITGACFEAGAGRVAHAEMLRSACVDLDAPHDPERVAAALAEVAALPPERRFPDAKAAVGAFLDHLDLTAVTGGVTS